jgi:hypothetical protein
MPGYVASIRGIACGSRAFDLGRTIYHQALTQTALFPVCFTLYFKSDLKQINFLFYFFTLN